MRLDAYCVTDEHFNILVANIPYCILTGYMPDELRYMNTKDLVVPAEQLVAANSRSELLQAGDLDKRVWNLQTKSGELVPIYVTASTIVTTEGQTLFVGLVEPINEERPLDFPIL